ncbi:dnaJ homolog subfamily C member 10-like [Melitaea cinxia]|uniref:dnaJ homolog subfamily C member 10-like n=1 Tax=Melitaea cinxia TaxID=113334 RepID=UPI001E272C88|nr:dnaJ homolog subfamily C member 10-like [Melitaea cinxia]
MGPSGAGKTTLLNALTGFSIEGVKGIIRAGDSKCELGNSQSSQDCLKEYRKKSCYILQDDRLNPLFTVGELMQFAADLKLGNCITPKLKDSVINEVLDTLGLSGTKNTRCCNLSGGQRKRLSIAVELIDNPPIIFLDEPTTGLDSLTSLHCMKMLKELAVAGRTVVFTIHQPPASLYKMFDQVYILAEGRCIYNGPSEDTVPYLASLGLQCPKYHNPADYILEIANGEYGELNEYLAAKISSSHYFTEKSPIEPQAAPKFACGKLTIVVNNPPELYKFNVLFRRCIIQLYRDWTVTHLKILMHIVLGVLMGLFYQYTGNDASKTFNNLGFLIVSAAYLCYTSMMPGVLKFPDELPVLKKENFNNWYNLKTYYAATLITSIPLQISFSIVYSAPSYVLTGQPVEIERFAMFVLVLANVTLLADAIGNLIGTCVQAINGTFFGAITTCTMIVFAGFLVLTSHMSPLMQYVSTISFLKYVLEALALSIYAFNRAPLVCPKDKIYCHLRYKFTLILLILFTSASSDVTYYEILGISKDATTQEIKQAYKKLAVKLHPDKNSNKDQQKRFLKITEAYETLKDPQKRHNYDIYGSEQSYTRKYDYQSQTEYNNLYYNGLYHEDPFVKTLSSRSFYSYLNEGLYFINFYSPFCPPCQNLAKHWKMLAETYKGIINVGAVNCKYYNSFCYNNMRIGSYPTLLFYPDGKNGNYLRYNGAHTFDALEEFVLKFVRSTVRVPVIANIVKTDEPILYVLDEDIGENKILKIAYHLNGIANVFMAGHIRTHLSNNPETVLVFKHNENVKEIQSTDENEIIKEVMEMLHPVEKIDFEMFQKIRNQLRNGYETPWVLYFTTDESNMLAFHQMRSAIPAMNFGVINCSRQEQLCLSLQTERGETAVWALLKSSGAFQRLRDVTRPSLRRAAHARALHSLSPSDLVRVLSGDMGIWVLLIAPYQVSWEHLDLPFTQASIEMLDSGISFGIMSCTASTNKYCRDLIHNEPAIIVQNGTINFRYTGDGSKDEIIDFIQLLKETSDIELSDEKAIEIESREAEEAWLVAFLPPACARACDVFRAHWRAVAQRMYFYHFYKSCNLFYLQLKPLDFVKVGLYDCDTLLFPFCKVIRTPIAKYFPLEAKRQVNTISLQYLNEVPYILESVLDQIYDRIVKLNWQAFSKNVIAEDLYPNRDKKPWLVYFHSPRCYHCYEMFPDFVITAYHLGNDLQYGKVNCITERTICQQEHISHYPTIKLYLNRQQGRTSTVIILKPKHYKKLIEDIKPHLLRYNSDFGIKNIDIKSHINFKDEL